MQGQMLVTGLVIMVVGVSIFMAATSVSSSIGRGVRSLFGIRPGDRRNSVWGVRGAGVFFFLFGVALGLLAISAGTG
ncbi:MULTISPECIES: hypothetical protein [unclassified Curtobacterium]|uniref:hypothetical protein n=1 Tax=unclassified Curtobacterium TaxID=257496 RepID=UPI0038255614